MSTRRTWLSALLAGTVAVGTTGPAGALSVAAAAAPVPSADQIVARNAAARGGLEAWQRVDTMVWSGHVESEGAPGRRMPFQLVQKRPGRTRFEVAAESQRSVRVFDGLQGWKLRTGGASLPDLQPFSEDETRFARASQVIDGPLMDFSARHGTFELEGVDMVDDRKAWVLRVRLPTGGGHRVWVDQETSLELRYDREVRSADGHGGVARISYRDYRDVQGLQMPMRLEASASAGGAANRLVIDDVLLNPTLDDKEFAKPSIPAQRRRAVTIDTRSVARAASSP